MDSLVLDSKISKRTEQYWLNKLTDGELNDWTFPWSSDTDLSDGICAVSLSESSSREITKICQNAQQTTVAYVMAALSLALAKYVGQTHLVINTRFNGRILPLKVTIDPSGTYGEHLKQVKREVLEGTGFADFLYSALLEKIESSRRIPDTGILKKVLINFDQTPSGDQQVFDTVIDIVQKERFQFIIRSAISLEFREVLTGFGASVEHLLINTKSFLKLSLKEINVLTESDQNKLLSEFNDNFRPSQLTTFLALFAEMVNSKPFHTALLFDDHRITYKCLDSRSQHVADRLTAYGIDKGMIVPILMAPGPGMIIGLLGILKSGAAFLPIDMNYPEERIQYMVQDSKAPLLLTARSCIDKIPGSVHTLCIEDIEFQLPTMHLPASATPGDLAYVVYTSGTTGTPNGVMITHEALANLCVWHNNFYQLSGEDISTKYAGFGFDASVWEIFPALSHGGCLYIVEEDARNDIRLLNDQYIKYGVTCSFLPTQLGEQFMTLGNTTLKKLLLGGDKLKQIGHNLSYEIYNNYGPTENTVVTTAGRVKKNEALIPIGKPIATSQVFIFSKDYRHLQPVGVPGELCISGPCLAKGYLHRPDLTNEKFIDNPLLEGQCMYVTGDLARWRPDGSIDFMGRKNSQVKLRGYRIELGEIESIMITHPDIRDAVVVKKEKENAFLCAYYTGEQSLSSEELSAFLGRKIPEYMVPSMFVRLDHIPLTPNNKTDRRWLTDKQENRGGKAQAAPANDLEKTILQVWKTVLGVEEIGVTDNFFQVGGDSIKAIQIQSRLLSQGYTLKAKSIFEFPSVRALSGVIDHKQRTEQQENIIGPVLLTPIQRRFFEDDGLINKSYFNQAVLLEWKEIVAVEWVEYIFRKIIAHHDALRMTFDTGGENITPYNQSTSELDLTVVECQDEEGTDHTIKEQCNRLQRSINLKTGPLLKLILFQGRSKSQLAVIIHHLVIDGVSWRILLEDIDFLFQQRKLNTADELPLKSDSFQHYAQKLQDYTSEYQTSVYPDQKLSDNTQGFSLARQKNYWLEVERNLDATVFGYLSEDVTNTISSLTSIDLVFDKKTTQSLLYEANEAYGTEVLHLLLAALSISLAKVNNGQSVPIWLEGHGRQEIFEDLDVSRTVGWFTTVYPILLPVVDADDIGRQIIETKEAYHQVPHRGIGYGMLRYLGGGMTSEASEEITFNYLGQFDQDIHKASFEVSNALVGDVVDVNNHPQSEVDITGLIAGQCLTITIKYNPSRLNEAMLKDFAQNFESTLRHIVTHCMLQQKRVFTASDFTYQHLEQEKIDELSDKHPLKDIYTLSPTQEGMLFHSMMNRSSANYYTQISYEVNFPFDKNLLKKSFESLVQRHDILRTAFIHRNLHKPVQVVLSRRSVELNYFDLSGSAESSIQKSIDEYEVSDKQRGFDLSEDSLIRLAVFKTKDEEHVFVWSYHHILMDGWCVGIIYEEFYHIYKALLTDSAVNLPITKPYKNYIQWLDQRDRDESRDYWNQYLQGFDKVTPIQFKKGITATYEVAQECLILTSEKLEILKQASVAGQLTLSAVLQGIWALILSRCTNSNDVTFGKVVAGRPLEIEGVDQMIGLFINTIPCRFRYKEDDKLIQLMQIAQQDHIHQEPHQYYGLSEIQKDHPLGNGLFDHIFTYENYPLDNLQMAEREFRLENLRAFEQTNYNLNIVAAPGEQLRITFSYNANTFDQFFIKGLKESFEEAIDQFCANTDVLIRDVSLIPVTTKEKFKREFNKPLTSFTTATYLDLFAKQVKSTPYQRALIHQDIQITYKQLDRRSDAVAARLTAIGLQKEQVVAVIIDRSIDMVVSLLGVLKSGAAFLPIDPEYPQDRIDYILENSQARIVVASGKYQSKLNSITDILFVEDLPDSSSFKSVEAPSLNDLAYVIYTSGTTGKPNGVMIEHQGLVNLCTWHNQHYQLLSEDISTKYAGFGFDATVWEIFPPFICGGCLYIIEDELRHDLKKLSAHYLKHSVTVSFLPTQVGERFMELKTTGLKKLLVGGDKLKKMQEHLSYEVHNNYGPTENTVVSTAGKVTALNDNISIGKAINTSNVYILDPSTLQLQPLGTPGELCLSGVGLARGYLNNEGLTRKKFVENPHDDTKLYRTGDLARWLPDGNIEFLGRIDNQVKVRGHRIELEEIESSLIAHEVIKEAAVVVSENKAGNSLLFAFYTAIQPNLNAEDLKLVLMDKLPAYMVPSHFTQLEELPMNFNGKVDKKALEKLCVMPATAGIRPKKMTDTQVRILAAWQEVLKVEQIGMDDNFFDLGGTSLDVMRLGEVLSDAYTSDDIVTMIFKYPTVGSYAAYVDNNQKEDVTLRLRTSLSEVKNKRQQQRDRRRLLNKRK